MARSEVVITCNCGKKAGGCINCGEKDRGGYETEEVGPFCAECWDLLRAALTGSPAAPSGPADFRAAVDAVVQQPDHSVCPRCGEGYCFNFQTRSVTCGCKP